MNERRKRQGCMLCTPLTPRYLESKLPENFIIQPKYKGYRAVTEWIDDEPILLSSTGLEIHNFPHIISAIRETFNPGVRPDGELYVHGWPQGRINSMCGRGNGNIHPDMHLVKYIIFDIKDLTLPQAERINLLESVITSTPFLSSAISIYTSKQNWFNFASHWTSVGYEGIVIRDPSALYEEKRSLSVFKYKPTESDEYIIVSVKEAISKDGDPKEMIGAFEVKAHDLEESFEVGAGRLSHEERISLWRRRDSLIGRKLVVNHEKEVTEKGIPYCCVAVEVK